jgi:hypothetical protein
MSKIKSDKLNKTMNSAKQPDLVLNYINFGN